MAALTGEHDFLAEMMAAFDRRRGYVVDRLSAMEGISCHQPGGAFYVFPRVDGVYGRRAGDKVIEGSVDLCAYLLDKAHVATVAGAAFGDDACVRISYATSRDKLAEGLDRLEAALGDLV